MSRSLFFWAGVLGAAYLLWLRPKLVRREEPAPEGVLPSLTERAFGWIGAGPEFEAWASSVRAGGPILSYEALRAPQTFQAPPTTEGEISTFTLAQQNDKIRELAQRYIFLGMEQDVAWARARLELGY